MSADGSQVKAKKRDQDRKWMWWVLGTIVALQLYFVQELLAAFALFAMAFLGMAGVVISAYTLHRVWVVTVDRVADRRREELRSFGVRGAVALTSLLQGLPVVLGEARQSGF